MATEYKLSYPAAEINEKLGKIVDLDTTLTHEGEAADAKATGDALNQIKDDLDTYYIKLSDISDCNDCGTELQNHFNVAKAKGYHNICFDGSTYKIKSCLKIPKGMSVDGRGSVIYYIGDYTSEVDKYVISNEFDADSYDLSEYLEKGQNSYGTKLRKGQNVFKVPNDVAKLIHTGDIVNFVDTNTHIDDKLYYPAMYGRIVRVGSDTVYTDNDYLMLRSLNDKECFANELTVYKNVCNGISIKNITVKTDRCEQILIALKHVINSRVENCKAIGTASRIGIYVIGIDCEVVDCYAEYMQDVKLIDNRTGYGIAVAGNGITVRHCTTLDCKHGISAPERKIFSRRIKYINNNILGNTLRVQNSQLKKFFDVDDSFRGTWSGIDAHANAIDVLISGNTITISPFFEKNIYASNGDNDIFRNAAIDIRCECGIVNNNIFHCNKADDLTYSFVVLDEFAKCAIVTNNIIYGFADSKRIFIVKVPDTIQDANVVSAGNVVVTGTAM